MREHSNDETTDLAETLVFTLGVIVDSDPLCRHQIAAAYQEAQKLVAGIATDNGLVRPRIVACLEKFNVCHDAGDVAAAGWMLTALQQRVNEEDLPGWEELKTVADKGVRLLSEPRERLH